MAELLKHPAEYFLRHIVISHPLITDAELIKTLDDWGFLQPHATYFGFLRQRVSQIPQGFNPHDRLHRPSVQFLRDQGVYEFFYPDSATNEAWGILSDPSKRLVVEQVLMSRLDMKLATQKLNQKYGWMFTIDGIQRFGHFFWNVKLLTFDEWGRFLYGRTALYERHMALLQGTPQLALFHLRIDQAFESKRMIQRTQEIAYHTLEEVNQRPGTAPDKIKAIAMLGKVVVEAHSALSTSDMALKDVLKQFEKFRMEHPSLPPPDIRQLAPAGNFTGSGAEKKKEEAEVH